MHTGAAHGTGIREERTRVRCAVQRKEDKPASYKLSGLRSPAAAPATGDGGVGGGAGRLAAPLARGGPACDPAADVAALRALRSTA
jgi:hypothetical protein